MTQAAPWPRLSRELVAILRGLEPDNALDTAGALVDAGFQAIEVPLNSPEPFRSIESIAKAFGDRILVGAGTVLTPADVDRLNDTGGRLVVSPNIDAAVLARAHEHGMVTMPGVFSPTEALAAVAAGAPALKFFPASVLGASGIKAISAVLPAGTIIGAVGGVSERDFGTYVRNGIRLFGLGSSIFRPGMDKREIAERARRTVSAWDAAVNGTLEA
ncbi:2-dehydro-3-deoxy-6-phosphogalactonate aldolase [Oricola thermophila]|uniref:2-dehydro-3-deoxy-6-phosphogalactonate aldolase n=1 Tax=Oricola thermophila TaxID=2742145 RepID=A0A6N1VCD0_9HYPH|nr:2-dehydro-3-deoxy-6-phosphogalactonate aldolase [Oricola thermophila]QKV18530.1 2-dehydro-3-deoxy-6-phosphogalactonate aldolase [Oricola thermophila]